MSIVTIIIIDATIVLILCVHNRIPCFTLLLLMSSSGKKGPEVILAGTDHGPIHDVKMYPEGKCHGFFGIIIDYTKPIFDLQVT